MHLRREVKPARDPDPPCIHADEAGPGYLLFVTIAILLVGSLIGYGVGFDHGYDLAVDLGYK